MEYLSTYEQGGIGTLVLNRGKVNALIDETVKEMHNTLYEFQMNPDIKAVIVTGKGKFFSFGFDVPEFLSYSKEEFTDFLIKFTDLYTTMFMYPKPIVAALNGHTIAGGCMLALACDRRIMVSGKARISLNEIDFGSSVFAGSTEMLRFWVGDKNATAILSSGAMYSAEEAEKLGLIDQAVTEENLIPAALDKALELGKKYNPAFAGIKSLLRKSIVENMKSREHKSIAEFVEIWYSDHTWENLKNIKIH